MKNEAFATAFVKVTEVGRWLSCAAFFILCSSFFISCSNPTPEELASLAAKGYYEHLAAGEYDAYLEGVNGVKDAPDDYKSQYRIAAEQYVKRVNQLHQGIKKVEVSSAKTDRPIVLRINRAARTRLKILFFIFLSLFYE